MFFRLAVLLGSMTLASCANKITSAQETVSQEMSTSLSAETYSPRWRCNGCSSSEKFVLRKIQEETNIKSRNSLAVILGNIKQESGFNANICEGGTRVTYENCKKGGYGIVQWTTPSRYFGLGEYAQKNNCDPSSLECQVGYMIAEPVFLKNLTRFERLVGNNDYFMGVAYSWLGWGIEGNRSKYAYGYYTKLERY